MIFETRLEILEKELNNINKIIKVCLMKLAVDGKRTMIQLIHGIIFLRPGKGKEAAYAILIAQLFIGGIMDGSTLKK
jgi:hypothetical protein